EIDREPRSPREDFGEQARRCRSKVLYDDDGSGKRFDHASENRLEHADTSERRDDRHDVEWWPKLPRSMVTSAARSAAPVAAAWRVYGTDHRKHLRYVLYRTQERSSDARAQTQSASHRALEAILRGDGEEPRGATNPLPAEALSPRGSDHRDLFPADRRHVP